VSYKDPGIVVTTSMHSHFAIGRSLLACCVYIASLPSTCIHIKKYGHKLKAHPPSFGMLEASAALILFDFAGREPKADRRFILTYCSSDVGSVRENSAFTLGSAMRSYQEEAIDKVILALEQLLPMAKHQVDKPCCCNGAKHRSPCSSTIHTKWHDPLSKLDSDFRTTSAIALVVASKGNGDDDQGFAREIEPWESSEGGIYLLRELSAVAPSKATKFLPVLVELAQSSGYVKYHNLMETLFRLLPSIAQNLGKRNFKPYLELFIDPLFQALTCGQVCAYLWVCIKL
jgi:hypothetical protein